MEFFKSCSIFRWFNHEAEANIVVFKNSKFLNSTSVAIKSIVKPLSFSWDLIEACLFLFVFALVFSPNISVYLGIPFDKFPLYLSDILILILCCMLLIKNALDGRNFVSSRLDIPIFAYIFIAILATVQGIAIGTINKPFIALFYFLKRIEYFLIFYIVLNLVRDRGQIRRYLTYWFVACAAISIYGIYEHFHPLAFTIRFYRLYERGLFFGQANHFAGFLMFFSCIGIALILFLRNKIQRCVIGVIVSMMFVSLLWTYSRQAYIALILGVLFIFLLASRKLLVLLIVILLFAPVIMPERVVNRVKMLGAEFKNDNIAQSAVASRVHNWKIALSSFAGHPFLGTGLGARHRNFYDSQFILEVSELGILGLAAFLYLLAAIFKEANLLFRRHKDPLLKALALGFSAGLLGLVAQSLFSVSFIITRIAGPMLFILGLVIASGEKTDG